MPPENIEVKYSLTLVNADTPDSVFRPKRIAKASFGRKNKAFSDAFTPEQIYKTQIRAQDRPKMAKSYARNVYNIVIS